MSSEDIAVVRDCAACDLAFSFNGLLESSIMTLPDCKVFSRNNFKFARVKVWKVREASKEHMFTYHRTESMSSPIDLFASWKRMRGRHVRFFAYRTYLVKYTPQCLKQFLHRLCGALSIRPPPDGKHSSHSLRMGSHTEQVMLCIPLEARMSLCFGSQAVLGCQ